MLNTRGSLLVERAAERKKFTRHDPREVAVLQFCECVESIYIESLVIEVAEIAGAAHRASTIEHSHRKGVDAEARVAEGNEGRVNAYNNQDE